VDFLMAYNGPNEKGLRLLDAISKEIIEEYQNEKIYDNKKTKVNIVVSNIENEKYQVVFDFESHKDDFHYNWDIDMQTGDILGNDEESKYIINLVDFYD